MAAHLTELTDIARGVLRDPDIELSVAGRLEDLPNWDSMHLIAMVVAIEWRFDLVFQPEDVEALHTVADLLRAIAAKQADAVA